MSEIKTVKIKATHPESQGPFVLINEGDFDKDKHSLFVSVAAPAAVVPPPPPPVTSADPLVNLPSNWRDWAKSDVAKLKALAAAVSDGRTVDNAQQAVEVIEAALAARSAK